MYHSIVVWLSQLCGHGGDSGQAEQACKVNSSNQKQHQTLASKISIKSVAANQPKLGNSNEAMNGKMTTAKLNKLPKIAKGTCSGKAFSSKVKAKKVSSKVACLKELSQPVDVYKTEAFEPGNSAIPDIGPSSKRVLGPLK